MRNAKEINAALDLLEAKSFAYGVWLQGLAMCSSPQTQALLISRAADAEAQLLASPMPDETQERAVAQLRLMNRLLLEALDAMKAQGWKGPDTTTPKA